MRREGWEGVSMNAPYTPFPPCKCPNCAQPVAPVEAHNAAENLAKNRRYEESHLRYRTENPHLTRDEIVDGGTF